MKKLLTLLWILTLCMAALTACGSNGGDKTPSDSSTKDLSANNDTQDKDNSKKIKVVTTIFPQYDIVRQIAGDHVELTMLLSPGAESHSYEPTPQDIIMIQECDVFIYVGGDSDEWIDHILDSIDNNMEIIALMDMVEVVEEEIVEGMEDDHGHSHSHNDFDDDDVTDRALSDWSGQWQSVYPYLQDGTLDEVLEHKAEVSEDMNRDDYYTYYENGYKTDIENIMIEGNTIEFINGDTSVKAEYTYTRFEILTDESGSKGVRYLFTAVDGTGDAPAYVQFSDHLIEPEASEHFHIYLGDESHKALLEEAENWPTYYPANMDGKAIAEEMLGHDHDDDHDDKHHDEEDVIEYDEHVWTSPKNAQKLTAGIANVLSKRDTANRETYQSAAAEYIEKLEELDTAFRDIVDNAARKTILVGDRFPFRYLVDEYGLNYFAAFSGCSTESDASAGTLVFLIEKVKEEELPVVFHIEFSNENIADTISEETGAQKLQLHSSHNITKKDFDNGITYLDLMYQNVENLKIALQ